jgi:hypothetical protein
VGTFLEKILEIDPGLADRLCDELEAKFKFDNIVGIVAVGGASLKGMDFLRQIIEEKVAEQQAIRDRVSKNYFALADIIHHNRKARYNSFSSFLLLFVVWSFFFLFCIFNWN